MTGQQLYEYLSQLTDIQRELSIIGIVDCKLPIDMCNYNTEYDGLERCVECGPNSGPLGEIKEYPYLKLRLKR